ncbi:hypothetical protein HYV88_02860 [Candidatus Woesearchaeota archaeon]|nr:hypothetical protein [Candidatus Woesearchaeota archaeon]
MSKEDDYLSRISKNVATRLGIPPDEVEKLFDNENLRHQLNYLHHQNVPERVAYGAVSKGMSEAMTEGKPLKSIKPEDVARGIYETLAGDRKYRVVAQNMLQDGIIESGDLKKIIQRTEESSKSAAKTGRVLEDLLKKAAVILLLVGGVYYIFKSIPSITGGVIGSSASGNIIFGSVLFLFALAISHFYIKE